MNSRRQVILLPGGVLPADLAYRALLEVLGPELEAVTKDLEVYASDRPPEGYSLATEVDGIARTAEDRGFARFHLVGYSGGGASALAYTAAHRERLLSLALMEPAWAGNAGLGPEESALRQRFDELRGLTADEFMERFQLLQLAPGVAPVPPPAGPPPPWMAKRPAGLTAFMTAFETASLDLDALRRFDRPVYFALGGRSNPDYYRRMAERLAAVFPDFTLEVFPERHHFDPPHRREPERVAASLRALWERAEAA